MPFPGSAPTFCAISGSLRVMVAVTSTLSLAEDVVGDATRWLANTAAGTEARQATASGRINLKLLAITYIGRMRQVISFEK